MPRNKSLLDKDFVMHEEIVKYPNNEFSPNRIRLIRLVNNMDIAELSDKLNISASTLQMIEMQQRPLSTKVLLNISKLFGVSTDYILYQSSSVDHEDNNKELKTNINELKKFFERK